jgi:hypothetical protein
MTVESVSSSYANLIWDPSSSLQRCYRRNQNTVVVIMRDFENREKPVSPSQGISTCVVGENMSPSFFDG